MPDDSNTNVIPIHKVAPEVCETYFEQFVEAMDLDVDPVGMDDEDKTSFVNAKRVMIAAMMDGSLVINDDGEPVYTPKKGHTDPITFHEPTGASYMAMDSKKKGHDVGKVYATMADITRCPATRFAKMANRDVKVCQAIIALFLG